MDLQNLARTSSKTVYASTDSVVANAAVDAIDVSAGIRLYFAGRPCKAVDTIAAAAVAYAAIEARHASTRIRGYFAIRAFEAVYTYAIAVAAGATILADNGVARRRYFAGGSRIPVDTITSPGSA